jgi:MFS family permease
MRANSMLSSTQPVHNPFNACPLPPNPPTPLLSPIVPSLHPSHTSFDATFSYSFSAPALNVATLLVGFLVDRYGPRRLALASCVTCIAGSLLFGASDSLRFNAFLPVSTALLIAWLCLTCALGFDAAGHRRIRSFYDDFQLRDAVPLAAGYGPQRLQRRFRLRRRVFWYLQCMFGAQSYVSHALLQASP